MPMKKLKIGELAKRTGSQVETIRYYEHEGLLAAPARSASNYRLYGEAQIERLQFIRHCRSLDMTLNEIRSLLVFQDTPGDNCGDVNDVLDRHMVHVADRIVELQALQEQLMVLRGLCQKIDAAKDCKIMQALMTTNVALPKKSGPHKGGCH